ncbi:hypothetical protein [Alienimonas californiensis]|uniref:Tetratricopeptide repeat protein n=1 Tax=Alienimonas californiensis TaxID=2527989 RepID=A0A517PFJ3_9PLAN|nr:hypothetical protein [Alienimonas californiensis]QDT18152.1 hypothetical protein CA12_42930 [Alienimonas californiensis]
MTDDLNQALEDAADRPYDARRVDAFAELARQADAEGSAEAAFNARLGLLDAAVMTNRFDVALAAFPRLLADVDAEPGRFALEDQLLLAFPMLLGGATSFPEIPRSRLRELGEDYAGRAAAAGRHASEIAGGLFRLAAATGDLDRAAELLRQMSDPWGGHFAECPHCRLRHELMLPWCADDQPAVLRLVRRLIDDDLHCTRFEFCGPREALILRPLALRDALPEAVRRYRAAASGIRSGPFWVVMPGLHVGFLAHLIRRGGTSDLSVADAADALRRLLIRCAALSEGVSPDNRMELLTAAAPAVAALAELDAVPALRLPAGDSLAPLAGRAGQAAPDALAAAMNAEAEALAVAFDRRNGNDFHLRHHRRHRAFALGRTDPDGA